MNKTQENEREKGGKGFVCTVVCVCWQGVGSDVEAVKGEKEGGEISKEMGVEEDQCKGGRQEENCAVKKTRSGRYRW